MAAILPAFKRFPKEGEIIGLLLAGYADLEVGLMNCTYMAIGNLDTALKEMFRERGESKRLTSAANRARPAYQALKLSTEFDRVMGGMWHCKDIRNQYAHCIWSDTPSRLGFVNLEEIACENQPITDLLALTRFYVDVPLLTSQLEYFGYVDDLLTYVNFEGQVRAGKTPTNPFPKPKKKKQPPLHIPQTEHTDLPPGQLP